MSVDEERGSGGEARIHGWGIPRIELDQDEALPGGTISVRFGPELVEEGLLELENFLHVHSGDVGAGGSGRVGENYVLELVGTGRQDGGALVDLGGIEEIEDGEVLDLEDLVHALNGEAAFAVEKVGDVGLFESGLMGQAESGEFSCGNAVPENLAEVILKDFELHFQRSIASGKVVTCHRVVTFCKGVRVVKVSGDGSGIPGARHSGVHRGG